MKVIKMATCHNKDIQIPDTISPLPKKRKGLLSTVITSCNASIIIIATPICSKNMIIFKNMIILIINFNNFNIIYIFNYTPGIIFLSYLILLITCANILNNTNVWLNYKDDIILLSFTI